MAAAALCVSSSDRDQHRLEQYADARLERRLVEVDRGLVGPLPTRQIGWDQRAVVLHRAAVRARRDLHVGQRIDAPIGARRAVAPEEGARYHAVLRLIEEAIEAENPERVPGSEGRLDDWLVTVWRVPGGDPLIEGG